MKQVYFIVFIISFIILVLPGLTNFEVANYHFYLLTILMIADFIQTKSISLMTVWIIAFMYIILPEMLLYRNNDYYSWSIRFLLSSNNVVLISYKVTANHLSKYKTNFEKQYDCIRPRLLVGIIIIMYITYIAQTFNHVVSNYYGTRQLSNAMGGSSLSSAFINTFGMILPALIGYYLVRVKHKSKWLALVISLPIFIFLLILATRAKMLFSIAPFFLVTNFVKFSNFTIKSFLILAVLAVSFVMLTNSSKQYRNNSFEDVLTMVFEENESEETINDDALSVKICKHGSSEGIVYLTYLADRYFENHQLKYGECTTFIFYFWVPRVFWPNKPTQLDYWMPRYFNRHLPDSYSSASGFTGEVRADFGLFSYFFMVLFGFLLKKANVFLKMSDFGRKESYSSLYILLIIPYVFFFVRSPVTSTIRLLFEVVSLYLVGRFCFAKTPHKGAIN